MKKIFQSLLMLSVLFFSSPYAAMADSYPENVVRKFENGVANAVSGFVEIPKNIMIASREEGPLYGMTFGLVAGVLHTVGRTLYGALDMATYMIPTQPLVEPNYIWNDFDKVTIFKPAVQLR